eukprot:m.190309 g.190309  ORF g.190309 m.190309 type:complete len:651 (-) comp14814_c0_seq1:111-2063(-)
MSSNPSSTSVEQRQGDSSSKGRAVTMRMPIQKISSSTRKGGKSPAQAQSQAQAQQQTPQQSLQAQQAQQQAQQKRLAAKRKPLLGAEAIRTITDRLKRSNPKQQLRLFQEETALSNTSGILGLVELMQKPRSELNLTIVRHLRNHLVMRLPTLPKDKLTPLLIQTFPYIQLEELCDIPLAILNRHPAIPQKILKHLKDQDAVLAKCSLDVKQQVWQYSPTLFEQRLEVEADAYATQCRQMWCDKDYSGHGSMVPEGAEVSCTSSSPTGAIHERIMRLCGGKPPLQAVAIKVVTSQYIKDGQMSRGTQVLQLHLAISAQSGPGQRRTPAHVAASCFERLLANPKSTVEIEKELFQTIMALPANSALLGQVGLMVRCPQVTNALCKVAFRYLDTLAKAHHLPRRHLNLSGITQVLGTGFQVREMLQRNEFRYPGLAVQILQEPYASIASLLTEDALHQLQQEKPEAAGESRSKPPQSLAAFARDVYYVRGILSQYLIAKSTAGDFRRIVQILPVLVDTTPLQDVEFMLVPLASHCLQSLLGNCWLQVVDAFPEVFKEVLVPLATKHIRLAIAVLDFLERSPEGVSSRSAFEKQLTTLATKCAHGVAKPLAQQYTPEFTQELKQRLRSLFEQVAHRAGHLKALAVFDKSAAKA